MLKNEPERYYFEQNELERIELEEMKEKMKVLTERFENENRMHQKCANDLESMRKVERKINNENSKFKKQVDQMERIILQLKKNLTEAEETNLGLLAENKSLIDLIVLEPDEDVFSQNGSSRKSTFRGSFGDSTFTPPNTRNLAAELASLERRGSTSSESMRKTPTPSGLSGATREKRESSSSSLRRVLNRAAAFSSLTRQNNNVTSTNSSSGSKNDAHHNVLTSRIAELEETLQEQTSQIASLESAMRQKDKIMEEKEAQILALEKICTETSTKINQMKVELQSATDKHEKVRSSVRALERNLNEERHYNDVARQELEKTSKALSKAKAQLLQQSQKADDGASQNIAIERQLNEVKNAYQRELEAKAAQNSLTNEAKAKYEQLILNERTKAIVYKWRYYAMKLQMERLRRTSSRKSSTVTTPRDSDMSFRFNQSLHVSFIDDNYADQEDIEKSIYEYESGDELPAVREEIADRIDETEIEEVNKNIVELREIQKEAKQEFEKLDVQGSSGSTDVVSVAKSMQDTMSGMMWYIQGKGPCQSDEDFIIAAKKLCFSAVELRDNGIPLLEGCRDIRLKKQLKMASEELEPLRHQLRLLSKVYARQGLEEIESTSINSMLINAKNLLQVVVDFVRAAHSCSIHSEKDEDKEDNLARRKELLRKSFQTDFKIAY
ncbi:Oidioi.mRNA.OKI2018_I69.PAR.g10157.t2.cds [Oikopleura dioica]|uniref:Oidioi.mRNA.OKI2018_I69.PAR.g10157.t2.cds n=1 Tax=Oikopleura dioica TaxID=34765 RepID=A0ABN7RTE7_OIKDI|nr:Oidioi.mRNA.OKI2018_I69.PAR.g10157.t2.cds [Oikopleura dioica]